MLDLFFTKCRRVIACLLSFLLLLASLTGCLDLTQQSSVPVSSGNQSASTSSGENASGSASGNASGGSETSSVPQRPSIDYDAAYPKSQTAMTNAELFRRNLSCQDRSSILVIYVSFADGYPCEMDALKGLLEGSGEESGNCMGSLKAYFYANSYGLDLFDFTYAHYACSMTSNEAWHYVNDENADGSFLGYDFYYQIFRDLKDAGAFDTSLLDQDGDGYIDATFFIFGDKTSGELEGSRIFGTAMSSTEEYEGFLPDPQDPTLGNLIRLSYDSLQRPLNPGTYEHSNTRTMIHETGHLFGLVDYYDGMPEEGADILDTLGGFDMQSGDVGDWNAFSKFTAGWLQPYVITDDIESVTLKIRCSSLCSDAILIPTSLGWNGTAFDEYLLIDVMAPAAANGFDWDILRENTHWYAQEQETEVKNVSGGVRILHVDARLLKQTGYMEYAPVEDVQALEKGKETVWYCFSNSNGYEPYFPELEHYQSPYYHLIDLIPSDGTAKYRTSMPISWSIYTPSNTMDLFGTGDEFSMAAHSEAFVNGAEGRMNNGGTLDYRVKVEYYDEENMEAYITICKGK